MKQPRVVKSMGSLLNFARDEDGVRFADLFTPNNPEARGAYAGGLMRLALLFIFFSVAWALVILVLFCKGREVGCASGRAFEVPIHLQRNYSETEESNESVSDDDSDYAR